MKMTKLRKTTTIYAPIDKLFEFIDDAEKVPVYSVGVSRVRDVMRTEKGVGDKMTLTYSVLWMHFAEQFTYIEYERPRLLVSRVKGPITGLFRVILEEEGDNQTMITLEVEYEIAGGVLGRAANKLLLERLNERNLERALRNIKMMVEAEWFGKGKEEKSQEIIS